MKFNLLKHQVIAVVGGLSFSIAQAQPVFNIYELGVAQGQASAYDAVASNNIRQSVDNEAGTLAMYSLKHSEQPDLAYMIEIYTDETAYQKHLQSPQYQAFMTQSPRILNEHKRKFALQPQFLGEKSAPIILDENTVTNFVSVTVKPQGLEIFRQAVMLEMQESLKAEDGVLAIYAATDTAQPQKWYFFEIYASEAAYQSHRQTPHFQTYLQQTAELLVDKVFYPITPAVLMNKGGLIFKRLITNNPKNKMSTQNSKPLFEKGEPLSADLITGKAWHNKLFEEDSIYTTAIGVEEFAAGSRNVWHSHPSGQILIVLDGVGYHQIKGEPIQIVNKGDVVKCPPNVLHWHGAAKDSNVTQIYILPNTEKGLADWSERVSDEEYNNINQTIK